MGSVNQYLCWLVAAGIHGNNWGALKLARASPFRKNNHSGLVFFLRGIFILLLFLKYWSCTCLAIYAYCFLPFLHQNFGRLRYVEQELAKKRGKNVDVADQVENEVKRAEDELYKIPEHLKVSSRFILVLLPIKIAKEIGKRAYVLLPFWFSLM